MKGCRGYSCVLPTAAITPDVPESIPVNQEEQSLFNFILYVRLRLRGEKMTAADLGLSPGPGLSFCLKLYLMSQHPIHINGSFPLPSLPGIVLNRVSRLPLLPNPSEGWCRSQPGLRWEACKSPFPDGQQVSSGVGLFSVSQPQCSCFSLSPSSGQPQLKINKTKQPWCDVM